MKKVLFQALFVAGFVLLPPFIHAQNAAGTCTSTAPCIQVCSFSGSVPLCKFVPVSSIQIPGPQGIQGVPGINGTNGTNGVDGKDGTNGIDGKDGINGTNGLNGTNGVDGKDGTNGADGKDGAPGPIGPDIPGLTYALNADGTTTLILNGHSTTPGSFTLDGFTLTCTSAGPKCQ